MTDLQLMERLEPMAKIMVEDMIGTAAIYAKEHNERSVEAQNAGLNPNLSAAERTAEKVYEMSVRMIVEALEVVFPTLPAERIKQEVQGLIQDYMLEMGWLR